MHDRRRCDRRSGCHLPTSPASRRNPFRARPRTPRTCPVRDTLVRIFTGRVLRHARTRVPTLTWIVPVGGSSYGDDGRLPERCENRRSVLVGRARARSERRCRSGDLQPVDRAWQATSTCTARTHGVGPLDLGGRLRPSLHFNESRPRGSGALRISWRGPTASGQPFRNSLVKPDASASER
jgi:hypothetical protein